MAGERPLEELRTEALDAARGLLDGERALAGALRTIREDSERAAETYHAVVQSLATALAARDGYTGGHSDIVHDLAVAVARRLGLDAAAVAEVEAVALLHDIGKIGVPDEVLHKQGGLDEAEWELMREHPVIGERILLHLPGLAGVATAVRHEHERWDGEGYPDRLAGEAIPLASRIVLACDTFNALVTDRPYRRALGVPEAKEELRRCSGTQFDPRVIDALLRCLDHEGNLTTGDGAPAIAPVRQRRRSWRPRGWSARCRLSSRSSRRQLLCNDSKTWPKSPPTRRGRQSAPLPSPSRASKQTLGS